MDVPKALVLEHAIRWTTEQKDSNAHAEQGELMSQGAH